jgi:predicted Zn-dependent protease
MHFPYDELALDARLDKLQIALLRSGGKHRRAPSAEEQAVQQFGQDLFAALFDGDIRSCYDVSLREADQQDRLLRLKLRILPPELNALPWEFMYDADQAEYVCLSRQTPIVRYLESPRVIKPLAVSPPLRVLGLVASPRDLPGLDVEREKQRVERATRDLRERGLLELEWLPGGTWRDLQEAMWGGPWHVFHFVGHGGFDARADEGYIALVDGDGCMNALTATRLGRLLRDQVALRLVLLNACEGAKGSERDINSSTASILVHKGIPAVVAMQYEITDRAAIEFARAFYRALAYGLAVDEAVVAARKAIDLAVTNSVEWGTPVLYMRAPDGVLFHMAGAPLAEAPVLAPPVDRELERRLEQRYTAGLSAFWLEEWDDACRHFQAIVEAQPDYQDAANKLDEARRQKKWSELYGQAQAARKAEKWDAALSALEELVAEKADYRDAAALLEAMSRQKRLASLYAQAQHLHQAQEWQAVLNVFAQLSTLDPDYPDADELLSTAQEGMAEQKRLAELDELYGRALEEMNAGQWAGAQQLLVQLQEMQPGFRETERLLARVEAEIERERAERQRQEKVAALYEQAIGQAEAGQWQQVQVIMDEIHALAPRFDDPQGLASRAEEEVARQQRLNDLLAQAQAARESCDWSPAISALEELAAEEPDFPGVAAQVEELKRLKDLYDRAIGEMDAENWGEAQHLLAQVQEREPGFREVQRLSARIATEIAREETERKQQLAKQFARAMEHFQAQRWQEAIEAFRAVIELDPEYGELAHGSAASLLATSRQERERSELPPPPAPRFRRPTTLPEEVESPGESVDPPAGTKNGNGE